MPVSNTTVVKRHLLEAWLAKEGAAIYGESIGTHGVDSLTVSLPVGQALRQLPISDRATLAVAVGRCLSGRPTMVMLSDSSRLAALQEVMEQAGKWAQSLPLVLSVPWDGVSCRPPIEGWTVLAPNNAGQAQAAFELALNSSGPVLFLHSAAAEGVGEVQQAFEAVKVLREGAHVCIATTGEGCEASLRVAERLAHSGVEVTVLDVAQWSSDLKQIGEQVRSTGRLVAVGDRSFCSLVHTATIESAFLYFEAPLGRSSVDESSIEAAVMSCISY